MCGFVFDWMPWFGVFGDLVLFAEVDWFVDLVFVFGLVGLALQFSLSDFVRWVSADFWVDAFLVV